MNDFQRIREPLTSKEASIVLAKNESDELYSKHTREMEEALVKEKLANIKHKNRYVLWIFGLVAIWLLAVFSLVVADGKTNLGFKVHKDVLITIITTTTIPVVGLLGYIVRALFKN
jgi:hypothetical protein